MRRELLLVLGLGLSVGCDNNPGKGKAVATVEPAKPVAETPSTTTSTVGTATAATKYVFSDANSKIEFVAAKVTKKHEGAFGVFSGAIELVQKGQSIATAEVATGSLTADDPKLASHLKTPDFLDTEKYPKARFITTMVRPGGANGATHTVTGNLTLHGATRSITFPATVKVSGEQVDAKAEFVLKRQDFGIVYPGMPDDLIKDEVLLRVDVHATQMPR
ncbi:MAG: YceI family protein [Polyangiales bacterium]